jgi:large subunit ribosomal protein L3
MKGILAKKIGMTRVIDQETGKVIPVTLLQAEGSDIMQVKTVEKDGYSAVVLGSFPRKNFGKNQNKKYKFIQEMGIIEGEAFKEGDTLTLASLDGVKRIKVTGTSKGRGFSGVIKRWNFQRGRETHGSHHHREPGSSGMCAKPGRILKGKKFPGQYGNVQKTKVTEIIEIDIEKNIIAVKGDVPGAKSGYLFIREY